MILGGSLLPVPYVIERPGPAIDVLGQYEDEEILVIDGAQTHPTDGELMMTTVSVDGGPGYRVTPVEVVAPGSIPPRWCCSVRRSSPRTGPGSRPPWPTPPR